MTNRTKGNTSTFRKSNNCPLHNAAARNDKVGILRLLTGLNKGAKHDLLNNVRNTNGQTPLHVAIKNNSHESFVLLVEEGCCLYSQDDLGDTVLHLAMRDWRGRFINYILMQERRRDINFDLANNAGHTPLHTLLLSSRLDILLKDVLNDFLRSFSADVLDKEGYSPFHLAIKLGRLDSVEIFLTALPTLKCQLTRNGEPPVWVALKHGHTDLIKTLVKYGCNINATNTKIGSPTIWLAVYAKNRSAAELLLGYPELDPKSIDAPSLDGTSPLMLAIIREEKELVNMLLARSAENCNLEQREMFKLAQKLMLAVATDADFELMKTLSQNREFVDDKDGNTLCHLAVLSESLKMVQGVTSISLNFNMVNNTGQTPLSMAKARNLTDIVIFLQSQNSSQGTKDTSIVEEKKCFDVVKNYPKFSDEHKDIFHAYRAANETFINVDYHQKCHVPLSTLKKYIVPNLKLQWTKSDSISKDTNGIPTNIPTLTSTMFHQKTQFESEDSHMMKAFLDVLCHIETFMREKDELFKHLDVSLLPVGSSVEGTKIGKLNELDVMFFCTYLHGSLSVADEKTIVIADEKYEILPAQVKTLFNPNDGKMNIAKFYSTFMQSVKIAIENIAKEGKIPKVIKACFVREKCSEPDCEANKGEEWQQCCHQKPPCVCYTAVGAGLNFVWKGNTNKNMIFTMDIVPNFYVHLNGLTNFSLRQKLIKYLIDQKPSGWCEFLKKYIRDDRIYMGQYDFEEKMASSVSIKMINSEGDFVIRPGLNMKVQKMLENSVVHDTYCLLKVLKAITGSKAKSFDLKKAISDALQSKVIMPEDALLFACEILNSPDLKGKFDGMCEALSHLYTQVDLIDFPSKNSQNNGIWFISNDVATMSQQIASRDRKGVEIKLSKLKVRMSDLWIHGKHLLHLAAETLQVSIVKALVRRGGNVNEKDIEGNTALHCVLKSHGGFCENNQELLQDVVKNLLESFVPEIQNENGETIFHLIAQKKHSQDLEYYEYLCLSTASETHLNLEDNTGHSAFFRACLNNNYTLAKAMKIIGVDVDKANHKGQTPLHLLSRKGNERIVQLLLTNGTFLNQEDDIGRMPIHYACAKGSNLVMRLLLQAGADPNAAGGRDGITPLYYASMNGLDDIVRELLFFKADCNKTSPEGQGPLHPACSGGHVNVARMLLKSGADVNRADNDFGETALMAASHKGFLEVVELLLEYKVDVNHVGKNFGLTALLASLQKGHFEIAKLLLHHGADVNACTLEGNTSLLYVRNDDSEVAEMLLKRNAALATKCNKEGLSPLHLACQDGHLQIAQLLLAQPAAGVMVNLVTLDQGATPLHMACLEGHVELVRLLLLQKGVNVDPVSSDAKGMTPLHMACQNGHDQIVMLLLEKKADATLVSLGQGLSPLHLACHKGRTEIARLLIEKYHVDIDKVDSVNGRTPLFLACESRHTDTVRLLLEMKAEVDTATLRDGITPLLLACEDGDLEIVKLLLLHGADVRKANAIDGNAALAAACFIGNFEMAQLLLKEEATDPSAANRLGVSCLHYACQKGHSEIAQLLLQRGADVNKATIDGATPLHLACQNGYLKIVTYLICHKADLNLAENTNGLTGLQFATREGHLDIVRCLLDNGADMNVNALQLAVEKNHLNIVRLFLAAAAVEVDMENDVNGFTSLMTAAYHGQMEMTRLLLDFGAADVSKASAQNGFTPLMVACQNGHLETIDLLLKRGAAINRISDKSGATALHLACGYGQTEAVRLLLQNGADVRIVEQNEMLPLDLAIIEGHTDIVDLLLTWPGLRTTLILHF